LDKKEKEKLMGEFDDLKSVREIMQEKREKAKKILPVSKSAQKEFIRDFLARHQDKFEDCMNQLAEYDPKTYVTIYAQLTKHMIPKQSEMSVTHGLDDDFKQLMALGMTTVEDEDEVNVLDIRKAPEIQDAEFEELDDWVDGTSDRKGNR
jgi:DNA-binding transcriptional ArsR family regulator